MPVAESMSLKFALKQHVCYSSDRPPGTSITSALNQHAFLLSYVSPAGMFETVATDLQANTSVVVWGEPAGIYVTLASDPQLYLLCSYPTNELR